MIDRSICDKINLSFRKYGQFFLCVADLINLYREQQTRNLSTQVQDLDLHGYSYFFSIYFSN